MNGITELAKILKGCENPLPFSPAFGTIKNLPDLKIQTESNIVLSKTQITSVFDVRKKDDNGNYIYLNKQAVLLPYENMNKYILIGVVHDG